MPDPVPSRPSLGVATGHEGDRVTTLELFFDLVFVFAFTQVTALMAHGEAPMSLLEAFIVLSLLWWSWCSYAWLANEARANRGVLRVAFITAMVAVFVACLAIPEAFHEVPGGLGASGTLVVCYAVVRLTHLAVYLVAAGEDRALRRQVLLTVATSVLPTVLALAAGVVVGGDAQVWIWLGAVLYDFAAIFLASRDGGGWAVRSVAHFAERHGLVVILALGESIVAIGAGVTEPLGWRIVVGAVASMGIAVGFWWSYFPHLLGQLEAGVAAQHGRARVRLARDLFTYLHFPLIAGIIVTALGVEQAMAHLSDPHLGSLGGWALGGGVALFLCVTSFILRHAGGPWLPARFVGATALVVVAPFLGEARPLVALGAALAVVGAVAVAETRPTLSPARPPRP